MDSHFYQLTYRREFRFQPSTYIRIIQLSGSYSTIIHTRARVHTHLSYGYLKGVLMKMDWANKYLTKNQLRMLFNQNGSKFNKNHLKLTTPTQHEIAIITHCLPIKSNSPILKTTKSKFKSKLKKEAFIGIKPPKQGSGIMWNPYNFPVFLLSQTSTMTMQEAAIKNEKSKKSYTDDVAEFDLVMQTMKSGTHDSESCQKENTCLPLEQSKPIILALASMDSASFFRDKGLGANSPISGLISLLAAVDALSHADGLDGFNKQLVFAVFAGEAWGYLGSRRFLLELDLQSNAVSGLNYSLIEKGLNQGIINFFIHKAGNSLTSGVVLEDFDTVFTKKFYHSHLNDLSKINLSSIVAAASLVARTLYILASDTKNLSSSGLTSINVNTSLVEELMGCLLDCEPGLSCALVKGYISPANTCPSHYVGVMLDEPSSTPYLGYVGDISRFVWNFLAERTSIPKENASYVLKIAVMTVKYALDRNRGKGCMRCLHNQYVPAYSTRLKFESGTWTLLPPSNSNPWGCYAVWTESNWDVIGLRVYTTQKFSFDHLLAVVIFKACLTKALKRD
ncbi:nicastrin [Pyrus ussuriensis x Pyrus communis]|uniref:Nicastrin n=1 Tax=Pyrus ussuriensis x Pyrus communis TaxID=2448454 RepID=A0A5N5GFS2_9ROSA|nr:nicastrin [Pyrus ussuriensis x Pyrus communis]